MASIDIEQAEQVFRRAIGDVQKAGWLPTSPFGADIGGVILGSHLTYRYIFLNGLLAKATDQTINPITLQAGSELPGAYDARSLCHKVVVKIERELLSSRLGGSNEPFLNKPARFPELSENNAVRRGRDKEILLSVIWILGGVPNDHFAYEALKDVIYFVLRRPARDISQQISREGDWNSIEEICFFIENFMSESMEGETSALVGGVAFDLLNKITKENLTVMVHPINQSGASSREISDIDVFHQEILIYTVEVKDKTFSQQDVDHAVSKAIGAGHNCLLFLMGSRASFRGRSLNHLIQEWADKGIDLVFFELRQYFKTILTLGAPVTKDEILISVNRHAKIARVKDETMVHLEECAKAMGWMGS